MPESAVSHAEAGVEEGQILAGKYRIEQVLGVGGMGVVVAARHMQLDTKVAIKFLSPSMLSNEESVARFAREARAAVRITGEHVARVLDVGTFDTGAPYMVMEFLEGTDLAGWLHDKGVLPVDQAVEFVLQACVAVAEAHALGIVHRDLKPANLFCIRRADGKSSVKVLDFGISKVTDQSSPESGMSVTKTTAVMGSPLYMSPEQMKASKSVDGRADIWALGVILYELLTARVPFEGDTVTDIAIKVATQPAVPVQALRPEVPAALDAVILKCLEKAREERYSNIAALALALHDFAPSRSRPLVERITDILQVAGPSSVSTPSPVFASPKEPTGTQLATNGGAGSTALAVTTTGRGSRGESKKRPIAPFAIGGVALLGLVGAFVSMALHKSTGGAKATAATEVTAPAPSASSNASATSPATPTQASSSSQPASVDTAVATPAPAASQAPASATTKNPAAHPAARQPASPKSASASPPAPAPHATAPPAHKNSLDLGGFQ